MKCLIQLTYEYSYKYLLTNNPASHQQTARCHQWIREIHWITLIRYGVFTGFTNFAVVGSTGEELVDVLSIVMNWQPVPVEKARASVMFDMKRRGHLLR